MIQLQFLNYILNSKDTSLIVLNNLTDNHFSDYKGEFSYVKRHLDRYGNVPDMETFLSSFPDFEVIKVNETPHYLIEELFTDYKKRKLAEVFNKIRTLLMNGKVDEATSLYQQEAENFYVGVSLQSVDILRDTSRYDAYLERTKDFTKYYIPTGFKELDHIIGGWDRHEELATIVARTNYGKSWILLKCAAAAAKQGLKVGIYSGEMSERKVGYRIDTLVGHIANGSLIHGNISVQAEYEQFIQQLPEMFTGSLKVLTPNMINGPADVNALRLFIEKEELDILFVDQLSLLEDHRHGKTPVEKAANISKDLKNLQVLKRVPIVSVSQQNRTKNEGGGVDTTQIAQSDRIGQDSTCIIFLERDEDIIKLNLVKSRDSANGKVLSYLADFNKGEFTFIPEEIEGGEQSFQPSESSEYLVPPSPSSPQREPAEEDVF
jgi:replicative DNA helicase